MRVILKPRWILDGLGNPPLTDHAVIVSGDTIEAVVPVSRVEPGSEDRVLDLPDQTLLPGLINVHVHLNLPGDNTPFLPWIDTQTDGALALRSAFNAVESLRAGVTTVRDCGGRGTTVLDLRDAQTVGLADGARIVSCGWPLTITGGHTRPFGGEGDGVEGVQRMTRRVVGCGADYVKVMASGGGTPGSYAQYAAFSVPELRAIVETAHGLGRPVAMHCIATQSIANAIEAGADLIEHAMFYDPDTVPRYDPRLGEALAKAGIPVTPTLQVGRDMIDLIPNASDRDVWQRRQEAHYRTVHELRALGVPLLAGSDAGWRATRFDTFWKELQELVACGLPPVAAVHAATGAASRALGLGDRVGSIASGLAANLVVVRDDVSQDVRHLADVALVINGGRILP